MFIQETNKSVVGKFFEDFRATGKYRYRAIVKGILKITFFKNIGTILALVQFVGNTPLVKQASNFCYRTNLPFNINNNQLCYLQ